MSYPHLDAYSRLLRGAHEAAVVGGNWPEQPRRLITASWRRSLEAGIDPEIKSAPLVYDRSHLKDARAAHPLRPLLPLLSQTLSSVAKETGNVMIVTDCDGRVLWREGCHASMSRADQIGLADGHNWSEHSVGTNGIGTALAANRPVHVYSEEHLMRVLHVWSCSAAPITDPDSGRIIGCVDVSGRARTLHPATVALVAAAAKLAETQLALRMHERDERLRRRYDSLRSGPGVLLSATGRVISGDPAGDLGNRVHLGEQPQRVPGRRMILRDGTVARLEPFSDGFLLHHVSSTATPILTLSFLGLGPPSATFDGHDRSLSLRHAEILALLALHPYGLTAEQLSCHLYGDDGNPVTIRAEIHRLRSQLGDAIAAKPYRLVCSVEADFLDLRRHLAAGDPRSLARAYTGPLLVRSESPEIRRERDELEAQVRACLLRHGAPEDLWAYAQTLNGRDDYEVLERLAALAPADPRSAAARSRLT
ncbi:GAF domain-containing protein [Nonomuraea jiangxiensis]|uniref:GAF domain-containing protein n=1 Tax=Nonomuraea jiangxiensis TaxID=633440 RepID=A0A1G8YBR8_9ACTN|nr:helix-turn-helix domain-containing protein [Nonomuraea jiangxiensis]SDJ99844.1 GAF domain-containing protein [Nonomuraea jiangxiensis]